MADPEAILRVPPMAMTPPPPPPRPVGQQPAPTAPGVPTLWACPKCGANNPEHTHFCFKCGAQLVRKCPECNNDTSLVATGFCGRCGYKYDIATKRRELSQAAERLKSEITALNGQITTAQAQKTGTGGMWAGFGIIILSLCAFGGGNSGAGAGIVLIVIGIGVLAIASASYQQAESKKNTDVANFNTASQEKASQLQMTQNMHKQLEIRKS